MALALPVFFISPLAGWLCDRSGPKILAVAGLISSIPFLVLLRLPHADPDDSTHQVVVLCVILAFLGTLLSDRLTRGATLTFIIPPSMSEIALIAGEHGSGNYGQAYGLFNVAFSAGFVVGPLWGGYVTESAGWNVMVGSLAGLVGACVFPVAIWTGGRLDLKAFKGRLLNRFRWTTRVVTETETSD
jgi:MFS family permease